MGIAFLIFAFVIIFIVNYAVESIFVILTNGNFYLTYLFSSLTMSLITTLIYFYPLIKAKKLNLGTFFKTYVYIAAFFLIVDVVVMSFQGVSLF